ncbi:uncharacterized protein LOC132611711 [Lycium barbarum]|uniref:uncharacterized protein LOC132611711 n=1 Tax=Lycium barbarum TaxID=112863 RepID=UPI00293F1697|nr:uncharacterized protein LOC132611711 [Lycium barbarum]
MTTLLERSMRTTLTSTSLSYDDFCIHLNLDLPKGFKVPCFELFNGTDNPEAHLRANYVQVVGVRDNQALIMRLFSRSFTGEASKWFIVLDISHCITLEDMVVTFIERFCFNMETVPNRYYLEKVKQKSTKKFCECASRWRTEAARVQPPMDEEELVSVFIRSQEKDFYDRMLSMEGRPFFELVKIGEAIEDSLNTGRIISMIEKSACSSSTGFIREKKKDVTSISHIPSPKTKRREDFSMGVYVSPPSNTYIPTSYNMVPVCYRRMTFQSSPSNYRAPQNAFQSPPPNYHAPQPNYQTSLPVYRTLQNNQPNTYKNQPLPNACNAPRQNFEKKPARDLIHRKEIVLQTTPTNVNTNPLPNRSNNVIHMIEREEDWVTGRPIICDSVNELERTVASLSLQERAQFKVLVPAPMAAHVALVTPAPPCKEFVVQVATAHEITRSWRCYTTKDLA